MREMKPTCDPNGVYSVKRVCAELGISYKTLRKYRESGYIKPLNPGNVYRPKYSGQSIIDCWHVPMHPLKQPADLDSHHTSPSMFSEKRHKAKFYLWFSDKDSALCHL